MRPYTQYILVFALVVCAFGQISAQTDTTKHQPTRQELYDQFHGTNKPKDDKNKRVKYIPTTAEELMKFDMETKAANKPAPDDHLVRSAWGIRLGMGLAGSTNNTFSLLKTNATGKAQLHSDRDVYNYQCQFEGETNCPGVFRVAL